MPETMPTILSLKNLYRLLTQADYPIPSDIPLSRAARKGVTIYVLFRETLARDLIIGPQGEKLWTVGDTRNRYLSTLFNRSQTGNFYSDYFQAAAQAITPALLTRLVRRVDSLLRRVGYDQDALCQRVSAYLNLVAQEDTEIAPTVHTYLSELMWQVTEYSSDRGRLRFFCAYMLSVIGLHAFFGLRMNNGPMGRLRREQAFRPETIFAAMAVPETQSPALRPELLTHTACELCREPLEEGSFFGRDALLKELKAQLRHGGKLMVSGMGGIGKTELLRQALKTTLREGIYTRVAFVQYRGNLMDSFLGAFFDLHGSSPPIRFKECLIRLSQDGARTLLLIDNMNTPRGQDQELGALSDLACNIVMTSRLSSLEGFRVLCLEDPGREAAVQIFTDNYQKPITPSEAPLLDHLLQEHLAYHPLMCTVLGNMARSRHLGIQTLYDNLKVEGLKGHYVHEAQSVKVEDTLLKLFHQTNLDQNLRSLLRLLALLPHRSYGFNSLQELLADITTDRNLLADYLETLRYLGWLSVRDEGFSVHPVITEALLSQAVTGAEYPRFFELMAAKTDMDRHREWTYVDIAYSALTHTDIKTKQMFSLALNTAVLLGEANLHHAMLNLLNKARARLSELTRDDPDLAFSFHNTELIYIRTQELFDEGRDTITRVLADFPNTKKPNSRPHALNSALFVAIKLSMQDEINRLYAYLTETAWEDPMEEAQYCYAMGEFHTLFTRNYPEMIAFGDRGLSILEAIGRENNIIAANLHHIKAIGCAHSARKEDASYHISRSKALITDWFGDTDSQVIAGYDGSLGTAYDQAGDYDAAIACFQRALAASKRNLPQENTMVESFLNNLANAYLHKGDLEQALHYSQKAYALHKKLNTVENTETSLLLNNRGAILRDSGRYEEALALFDESRELARKLVGEDSIPYAEPTLNAGRALMHLGRKAQALECMGQALPLFEKYYGLEHARTNLAREKLKKAQALPD